MPEINLTAGVLPPPACFASEQDRLDAYAAALIAQFATSPEWVASAIAPVAPNLGLYWLRLDAGGNPVEILKYNTTAPAGWARVTTQLTYGVGGGVPDAYTVTLAPASPGVNQAYRTGATYAFGASNANTGPSTLSVDGFATKAITKYGTTALVANDIRLGQMCVVVYDGTRFQLLNPGQNIGPASFAPGTDRQFLRTNSAPASVWESGYITPVANYQAIPAAGASVTFSHGFTVDPLSWDIGIICTDATGDAGYTGINPAGGDYIPVGSILRTNLSESDIRVTGFSNATTIGLVRGSAVSGIAVNHKTTGVLTAIDEAKWRVMARAIR
jgi:hypothetical protein